VPEGLTGRGVFMAGDWMRQGPGSHGRAVHVDPMKPKLKAPGTKLWKLEHEKLLLRFAFNYNWRHYTTARGG
jgi:hypothetical protein